MKHFRKVVSIALISGTILAGCVIPRPRYQSSTVDMRVALWDPAEYHVSTVDIRPEILLKCKSFKLTDKDISDLANAVDNKSQKEQMIAEITRRKERYINCTDMANDLNSNYGNQIAQANKELEIPGLVPKHDAITNLYMHVKANPSKFSNHYLDRLERVILDYTPAFQKVATFKVTHKGGQGCSSLYSGGPDNFFSPVLNIDLTLDYRKMANSDFGPMMKQCWDITDYKEVNESGNAPSNVICRPIDDFGRPSKNYCASAERNRYAITRNPERFVKPE